MRKILPGLIFTPFLFFSTAHCQLWKQYADSAKSLNDQRKTAEAIGLYAKSLQELKKDSSGTKSYVLVSTSLANLYRDAKQYDKAETLYVSAKQITEVTGKQTAEYATSCYNLGRLYNLMSKYQMAEPLLLEAKQIRKKVLGKESADYAASCNTLGLLYWYMGQYEKAEPLYLEGKQIREKVLGNEHFGYAISCDNLGLLYSDLGQYEKAETLWLKARQIYEKVLGKENPDYAGSCHNLGSLYKKMGQYEKAEALSMEAKKIEEKVLGKENPDYAGSCNNLGILYMNTGQYEKAEPLYLEAKKIQEKVSGKEHPDYAMNCNNLGNLYRDMGQYEKAEALLLEARQIWGKLLGKENPDYAGSCSNLGILYMNMGQYEKAEPLLLEAKKIEEKVLGKEHPDYAIDCNHLGNLYMDMRQYEKAEPLLLEAKQIREKVLGKEHPNYAHSCDNLGDLYMDLGQYEKAEGLYLEQKKILEKGLGKENPDYTESCINLADLYWAVKKFEKADGFYAEIFQSQNTQTNKIFQFTSETEKQSYLKTIADFNSHFLSFNTSVYHHSQQGLTYKVLLSNRNLILKSSQQLRQEISNTCDTSVKNKYDKWIEARKQVSFWYTKPVADRPEYVNDLEEEANTLEKELTLISSAFNMQQNKDDITWQTIRQNLEPNEAAIEFVDFNFYNGKSYTDSIYYIALLLRKDEPQPQLIKLFEKKQLDSVLNNNDVTDLYKLAWKPLEKYLTGISKIYFAPAGDLFKISFSALPVDDKQVLSDKYQLVQLNTTASVTDKNENFISSSDKIQLYGGIEYNADTTQLKTVAVAWHSANEISRSLPDDLERSGNIQFLPGTKTEIDEIQRQAGKANTSVVILSGINATEESFKALNGNASPSVLHIATHGFFFPDPKERDSIQRRFETTAKVFKQSDNPLFRSGLLFAGANNAWQGKPVSGIEDGIVTAYDVSNMYLPNTKLVVLSACETALGDIEGSEGVYGLQRAFKIAGAQNLVMSLWKVPDAETAEFMEVFYSNMFNEQTVSDAFYHAQTTMKNKYRSEPVKWAAWILVR